MAFASASCSLASQLLPCSKNPVFRSMKRTALTFLCVPYPTQYQLLFSSLCVAAASKNNSDDNTVQSGKKSNNRNDQVASETEDIEVEVEEELPWIQEKALDVVEFTGSLTQALVELTGSITRAIPGPRVGTSSLPWILAVPLDYAGLTFVIAFAKAVRKFTSPKAKRRLFCPLLFISSILIHELIIAAAAIHYNMLDSIAC